MLLSISSINISDTKMMNTHIKTYNNDRASQEDQFVSMSDFQSVNCQLCTCYRRSTMY